MFAACSPQDGFGLASCSSRGLPPASPASDPSTVLTFAHRGGKLSLTLRHCAHQSAHTGGHVWSGSRHLSRWLFARRHLLPGQRVLELGCGLALPGLLAATLGATVVATDELNALVEHGRRHTAAGVDAGRLTMQRLDFTARRDVLRLVDDDWDLIMFADCVFGGRMGELLPHALCELLRGRPGRRAVGTFPSEIRAGITAFWEQAAAVGLEWEEQPPTDEAGQLLAEAAADSRWGHLYIFTAPAGAKPREGWGEEEEADDVALGLAPLFDEVERGGDGGMDAGSLDLS